MTRRTRLQLLFALPAVLVVALVAAWLVWPSTAITRENAEKIKEGMTLAEVEVILGGRARDEATGRLVLDVTAGGQDDVELRAALYEHTLLEVFRDQDRGGRPPRLLEWNSNQVTIWVCVDRDGRVTDCNSLPMRRADETPIDRVRRWYGL
jgi:hypothetical protein